MNDQTDYRIENIKNRELKLREQRRDILFCDSQTALDKILDAPAPASLVQSFPDQDLYYLMHKIGPDDFLPVLSLATSRQWEYILDVEIWDRDRLNPDSITRITELLFQADPARLVRWGLTEKTDLFEFYLNFYMDIKIREHDEPPPSDFDDYITLDDKFYFRFPDRSQLPDEEMPVPRDHPPAWDVIEKMVKLVAQMDLSVFHGLMLETTSLLPAEIEEEEFRLKNARLAEKGFLPTHEAIGIYQPISVDALRKRETVHTKSIRFDPDIPLPPQYFSSFLEGSNLLVAALKLFDSSFSLVLESELAALINKLISADKIKLTGPGDLEKAIHKTCAYLNLGLEVLLKKDFTPHHAKKLIEQYYLEDIFRSGSRSCIQLKTKAANWFKTSFMNKNGLPLGFLGENYLGVIGGLFIDRPKFYDPDISDLYTEFESMAHIEKTQIDLDRIIALDNILGRVKVDLSGFKQGVLTYKSLLLTLWAKNRMGQPETLDPIDIKQFQAFFTQLFDAKADDGHHQVPLNDFLIWITEAAEMTDSEIPHEISDLLADLMEELEQEYGQVSPEDLDPRFIPHFLLV